MTVRRFCDVGVGAVDMDWEVYLLRGEGWSILGVARCSIRLAMSVCVRVEGPDI